MRRGFIKFRKIMWDAKFRVTGHTFQRVEFTVKGLGLGFLG